MRIVLMVICFGMSVVGACKGADMMVEVARKHDFSINVLRRKDLLNSIQQKYPNQDGIVLLFAGFEGEGKAFRQESSFYYLTGIQEPGVVLMLDMRGHSTLYIPNCGDTRSQWMFSSVALTQENAVNIGIDRVTVLGSACVGYQFHPFFPRTEYDALLAHIQKTVEQKRPIFTLNPHNAHEYIEQRLILTRLENFIPGSAQCVTDISSLVADQRRIKDMKEIELLYKATEITMLAQEAAAQVITDQITECEVQASLEYIFIASGARPSFPSIVGSGKNSTILHYTINNATMKDGDLVIVDIGAEYNNYCADLTRTYPVSGKFTKRQREVYTMVLDTQEYIASIAQPGYWLNNKDVPEKSLNHLARAYLAKKGYDQYFVHGIGHYLGLDVHDVGDYKKPLQEGDVFTIEPGIYIPEERLGVRIEDDYWMVKEGVVCLSEQLPKKPEDIEEFMQQKDLSEESDEESDDYFEDDEDEEMSQA